jgi:hypothetical protein
MNLFKYQGAAMFPGCAPGDTVDFDSITWTVTDQGHLEATVPDPLPGSATENAIDCAVFAEQTDPITEP